MSNINNNNKKRASKASRSIERSLDSDVKDIRRGSRSELSGVCQDYLRALVDTRNAKKVGVPTILGGMPGRTGVERFTEQTDIYVGAQGFGFISCQPNDNSTTHPGGLYNDGVAFTATTLPSYNLPGLPQAGTGLATGLTQFGWAQSPYTVGDYDPVELSYRVVGCTMKIFPEASTLDQNGKIFLVEAPNHASMNQVATSKTTLMSYPKARVLRGAQVTNLSEEIVLNWHPRSGPKYGASLVSMNDFEFMSAHGIVPTSTTGPLHGLLIGVVGTAGTAYHVETTVMYEVKGTRVINIKPRLVDSRGMDLIINILAAKMVAGYVGVPDHVYEGYLYKAWESAKKIGGFISKHEKQIMQGGGAALKALAGLA